MCSVYTSTDGDGSDSSDGDGGYGSDGSDGGVVVLVCGCSD